jgi:taurine dioxygenase
MAFLWQRVFHLSGKGPPMSDLTITRLTGAVGAEISGVDLNRISESQFDTLRDTLFDRGVVVLRGQNITPEAHIALAERFGDIDVNRFFTPVATHPVIAEVRTRADQNTVIGGTWHSDHSYDPEPAMASILVARELPPYGGDTLFASMTAACAGLSDGLRAMLGQMNAWHSDGSFAQSGFDMGKDAAAFRPPSLHPVLIRHPDTGAQAVYVNGDFTTHFDGWSKEESRPLLDYLYRTVTQPQYCCRVRWTPGSVGIWDNRTVQHFATADYQGHARLMHRITVKGQALTA